MISATSLLLCFSGISGIMKQKTDPAKEGGMICISAIYK